MDAPRYHAFADSMSVDVDAAWFVDLARWRALQASAAIARGAGKPAPGLPLPQDPSNWAMIWSIAQDQGVDPDYMLRLARRESGFNPLAHARRSSASGLFQFTDDTWLCNLRLYGADLGVGEAANIYRGRDGRCRVQDPADRFYLLSLRFNGALNTQVAARHTLSNQRLLEFQGRVPTRADLYALHFFGSGDGQAFLSAPADAYGYQVTPKAADANPGVFYDHGRPLRVWEIYRNFGAL